MTPFEIAMAIRNRPHDGESVQDFALRTMAGQQISDFGAALNLLIAWEQASDEVEKLLNALRSVTRRGPDEQIGMLIQRSRELGYNAALEAVLARRWRCPHCKQFSTIDRVELPIGDASRLPRCMICREEGIAPFTTQMKLQAHDGGKTGLRPI